MENRAYYNEHDAFKAEWLRKLIDAGAIARGEVDERDIRQVEPADLRGFVQCHFFAGIGVWSYALRAAGWADDFAVWTGSCPCQSFSTSGKRRGFSDHRHLWPAWFRLIRQSRPGHVFGEQVAARDGLAWFDVVSLTWKERITPSGRRIPALRGTVRRCSASGFTSWPRPRANDAEKRGNVTDNPRNGMVTAANLAGWNRPQATDFHGGTENRVLDRSQSHHGRRNSDLALLSSWGRPTATDGKGSGPTVMRKDGKLRNDRLLYQAEQFVDFGQTPSGCPAATDGIARLNPAHSRWLMALPIVWESCADMVTLSVRNKRRASSKPTWK